MVLTRLYIINFAKFKTFMLTEYIHSLTLFPDGRMTAIILSLKGIFLNPVKLSSKSTIKDHIENHPTIGTRNSEQPSLKPIPCF